MADRCGGCRHAAHKGKCRGKAPSGCVPFSIGGGTGFICGSRPACPCAWRTCKCGALVATTTMTTGTGEWAGAWAVPVLRGSAGTGTLAVRRAVDGTLTSRELADGENPGPGEWRGDEHTCEFEPLNPEPEKTAS